MIHNFITRFFFFSLISVSLFSLVGCDSEPPKLMKASKQFKSDEKRDHHIAHMRTHHMHALKHKRDETMYQGIRTEDHSLKACINCHVPESFNGKVLRHTDQEHFCTTCHTYVAAKLDCFECHVDHPVKAIAMDAFNDASSDISNDLPVNNLTELSQDELIDLAFKYSDLTIDKEKQLQSGGVSLKNKNQSNLNDLEKTNTSKKDEVINE